MVREEGPGIDGESALFREVGEARDGILPVGIVREDDPPSNPRNHVGAVGCIQAALAGHWEEHGIRKRKRSSASVCKKSQSAQLKFSSLSACNDHTEIPTEDARTTLLSRLAVVLNSG